jgi:AraC-like DNA-binding protein
MIVKKIYKTLIFIVLCLQVLLLKAQIRIEITELPELLLPTEGVYLAGSFNNWAPGESKYQFKKDASGILFVILPDTLTSFKYKVTQGVWTVVEGGEGGAHRGDRIYDARIEENPKSVRIRVESWESRLSYRFIIKKLPKNTPHDATFYIAGNFNNWNPQHNAYKLQKQSDGTYRVTVVTDLNRLEFKFTRGTWGSVEGRASGKARANRIIKRDDHVLNIDAIEVQIESWEDLIGTFNFFSLYDLSILFAVFHSLLLFFTIPTIQNYNRRANQWLVFLLLLTAFLLLVRVLGAYRELVQLYPRILLVPDFIWCTYSPIFYFYVNKLLFQDVEKTWKVRLHIVPFLVQLLVYFPFLVSDDENLKNKTLNLDPNLYNIFGIFGLLGLVINSYYWITIWKQIDEYKEQAKSSFSYEENLNYLRTIMFVKALCLAIWVLISIFAILNRIFQIDLLVSVIEKTTDFNWLIFSMIPHFLGYFAIHQPEIFKVAQPTSIFGETNEVLIEEEKVADVVERKTPLPSIEDLDALKQTLESQMERLKPYTNPKLTINELAGKVKMQSYILSKVINEGYDKNFFDFINSYRIEEFKRCVRDPRYKNYTLLAIAFEVGFNSKTAFNRAFKKLTNQSPSEYFNSDELKEETE